MTKQHTIGGYGHTEESFFSALEDAAIDLFVDVRQRRGVRGPKYRFLNSRALQEGLARRRIDYFYMKEAAPTISIRETQKNADLKGGVMKHLRTRLSFSFREQYISSILSNLDRDRALQLFLKYENICFFCVEGPAAACHRSLIAEHFEDALGSARNI